MLDLPVLFEDLPGIIDVQTRALHAASPEEYGQRCEDLCRVHRAAAAGELFINYDPQGYRARLTTSGQTRVFLLERTTEAGKSTSRFCKISRSNGLFDAVASGSNQVAREIVSLSPKARVEAFEYADDYAYVRLVHGLVAKESEGSLEQSLDRFVVALGDRPSARLPVCAALIDRDADAFLAAFADLVEVRQEELLAQAQSPSRDEMEHVSARHLFVEGLALLSLARDRGVEVRAEFSGCPREAQDLGNP